MWRHVVAVGCVLLGLVNLALFALWISLIRIEANRPPDERQYVLDSVALSIGVLEVVLAAVGIGLALLGIFGFQEIRQSATTRAEATARETARRVADDEVKAAMRVLEERGIQARHFPSQPSVPAEAAGTAGAERASEQE